jgi:hypothetical protein
VREARRSALTPSICGTRAKFLNDYSRARARKNGCEQDRELSFAVFVLELAFGRFRSTAQTFAVSN